MSEPKPFFVGLPWEFLDAWLTDRRVKQKHVLCALYIARRCFEAINTSDGVAPIELSTLARLCDCSTETIRRTLHDLRAWEWIDFETGDGGDPAWRIRLTGLTLDTTSPQPLHKNTLRSVERSLHTPDGVDGQKPALQEGFDPHDLSTKHSERSPHTRRNETDKKREKQNLSEKKLVHVLGKTPAAVLDETAEEVNFLHAVGEAAAAALENERAFLADCQELVEADHARWVDNGDGRLSEEQMFELGALPLGEVRRRHEAGEL